MELYSQCVETCHGAVQSVCGAMSWIHEVELHNKCVETCRGAVQSVCGAMSWIHEVEP